MEFWVLRSLRFSLSSASVETFATVSSLRSNRFTVFFLQVNKEKIVENEMSIVSSQLP